MQENNNTSQENGLPQRKNIFQKFYGFVDSIFPFSSANESSYMRVKSNIAVLIGLMTFMFFLFQIFSGYSFLVKAEIISPVSFIEKESTPSLAIVEINSEITIPMSKHFEEVMESLKTNDQVKSVLVIFNSGGGSPAASDDMAHYIEDFRKIKPVNSYVQSICASGAYYIASATEKIYANPTSIVGSIGVVLPHYNGAELAKTIGIEENYVAAGKHKVPLSLMKKMSTDEEKYLQNQLLLPTYEVFKAYVARTRNLSSEQINEVSEGIIYVSAMDEVKGVLVDETISLIQLKNNIKKGIAEASNIDVNNVQTVTFNAKPVDKKSLIGLSMDVGSKQFENMLNTSSGVQYKSGF